MDSKYKKASDFCAFLRDVFVTFVMLILCAMFLCAAVYFMFALAVGW